MCKITQHKAKRVFYYLMIQCLFLSSTTYSENELESEPESIKESIAFFYGEKPPIKALKHYQHVVIESAQLKPKQLSELQTSKNTVYAYISMGEFEPWRPSNNHLPKKSFLSEDSQWNSIIVDPSHLVWQEYILSQRIEPLVKAGYQGIFLDTLDSFQRVIKEHSKISTINQNLSRFIITLREKYPELKILINRGFELLPDIHQVIQGVVCESLFHTFKQEKNNFSFHNTTLQHQKTLLDELNKIKTGFKLPVYIIDYLPESKKEKRQLTAEKIQQLGFSPWISTPTLNHMGTGYLTYQPRKILMLYDSSQSTNTPFHEEPIFKHITPIIDYYGYIAEFHDVSTSLPTERLVGEYAGIISWFKKTIRQKGFDLWYKKQLDEGMKFSIIQHSGLTDRANQKILNILPLKKFNAKNVITENESDWLNYESAFQLQQYQHQSTPLEALEILKTCQNCKSHASYKLKTPVGNTQYLHGVISADWGSWVSEPWIFKFLPGSMMKWIIDPFKFLNETLALDTIPAPDVTTHLGRRLLITHIDGDGFLNRAELPSTPYSSQVILDEVLKQYPIKHTVSIIEGEIGPTGMHPNISQELEEIAKKIFELPHIEAASHTYSHPFHWHKLNKQKPNDDPYHLNIRNYRYSAHRDLIGSIKYIDKLLPAQKKTQVLLWSGTALPREKDLAVLDKYGYLNMNGGNTVARKRKNSILYVSPMYRPVGKYIQIFAPIMNENVYTNDWTGPFHGFRNVIQTLKFTDKPKRLKPINIYYHFYSGEKISALKALQDVYDWSLKQDYFDIYASEYINKVNNYFEISMYSTLDKHFQIYDASEIQSFRTPLVKNISITKSEGLIGLRKLHDGTYLHTSPNTPISLNFNETDVLAEPYIVQSTNEINTWNVIGNQIFLTVNTDHTNKKHAFIDINYSNLKCQNKEDSGDIIVVKTESNLSRIMIDYSKNHTLEILCQFESTHHQDIDLMNQGMES